ncbi:MAG: AMP-dependent synthetase/ligase [Rectinema subterraneum]|uniref:AMP-dependent synthetase/ligase n=1 Tax=Rectinema subterraneum TaxID=2653714 RepID=UPI003C7B401F
MADTIPQMFIEVTSKQPDVNVQLSKDSQGKFQPTTYQTLLREVSIGALGLRNLGIQRGDRIGFISDNRKEWLIADLAILGLGAADVPRGCDATAQEIAYILSWSECAFAILENDRQLQKILDIKAGRLPFGSQSLTEAPYVHLKTIILFDPPSSAISEEAARNGLQVLLFSDIMDTGRSLYATDPDFYAKEAKAGARGDLATIIYTSGTTGDPKGVMLSHGNFLHQTEYLPSIIGVKSGEIFLSVLPVWHSFERVVQYIILQAGATIAYSKPVGSILLADMQAVQPHWFTSVPRIWESIKDSVYKSVRQSSAVKRAMFSVFIAIGEAHAYFRNMLLDRLPKFSPRARAVDIGVAVIPFVLLSPLRALGDVLVFKKIKEKLGKRFIAGVSGGGALPPSVDKFFDALGILILEGYGLTETAPVLGVRLKNHPVSGTIGPIHRGTEIRIVDEHGNALPPGHKGVIQVRGPQVMLGYYKRPDLTAKILSADGWLDTGDLGMLTVHGEIKIVGRAKDTIVLRGGENIEPVPIEQRLGESAFIQQAVVLGQDQKYLAALIVPRQEALIAWAEENEIPFNDYPSLLDQPEVKELIDSEINSLVSMKNGFKPFERIFRFALLPNPFEPGRELSAKQEMKRFTINELYKKQIRELFAE